MISTVLPSAPSAGASERDGDVQAYAAVGVDRRATGAIYDEAPAGGAVDAQELRPSQPVSRTKPEHSIDIVWMRPVGPGSA